MRTKISDLMMDTETGEIFEQQTSITLETDLETDVDMLNRLQADAEAADDEIEIPPAPEGVSLVQHLIDCAVIPPGTPVYEVSDATDVAEIIEAELSGKGKTVH